MYCQAFLPIHDSILPEKSEWKHANNVGWAVGEVSSTPSDLDETFRIN